MHKDFRTLFVFKHRRKTKKFTLKWQIPLIEKRVTLIVFGINIQPGFHWNALCIHTGELVLLAGGEGEQDLVGGGEGAVPCVVVQSPL